MSCRKKLLKKKLKYTYILRISIAIRCDVSKKKFVSMITLNPRVYVKLRAKITDFIYDGDIAVSASDTKIPVKYKASM